MNAAESLKCEANIDAQSGRMALDAICEIPAPAGLIVWLDKHSPYLYCKLTSDLPDQISRAWAAKVSLQEFDALCSQFVGTYRHAAELYGTVERNGKPDDDKSIS